MSSLLQDPHLTNIHHCSMVTAGNKVAGSKDSSETSEDPDHTASAFFVIISCSLSSKCAMRVSKN